MDLMLLYLLMVLQVTPSRALLCNLLYNINFLGAGKTHTMIGNDIAGPGVMVLTMRDLFLEVENSKADKNYKISKNKQNGNDNNTL